MIRATMIPAVMTQTGKIGAQKRKCETRRESRSPKTIRSSGSACRRHYWALLLDTENAVHEYATIKGTQGVLTKKTLGRILRVEDDINSLYTLVLDQARAYRGTCPGPDDSARTALFMVC
jgi:hypothetical protein